MDWIHHVQSPGLVLATALLLLVGTFCWCWRERCLRRSVKEIEKQRHNQRVELLREYANLFSTGKLAPDDLPLIARLERIEPPDEIEPPAAS